MNDIKHERSNNSFYLCKQEQNSWTTVITYGRNILYGTQFGPMIYHRFIGLMGLWRYG